MSTNYPTALDSYSTLVDNTDNIVAAHPNDRGDAIEALEAKVGIDSSAVATSHDYLMTHLPAQGQNWDAGGYEIRSATFESDVATGTAPFTIASTTVCTNLNADLLDGAHKPTGDIVGTTDTQTLTNKTLTSPTIGTSIALPAGAVDAITEIASGLKSGSDTTLVTGTAGTTNYTSKWNADGDLVDGYAVIDDDTMATASSSNLCSGESIKAYADSLQGQYDGSTVFSSTIPTAYTDLDLSAYVGSNRALVYLRVYGASSTRLRFRTNGETVNIGQGDFPGGASSISINNTCGYVLVATDASGVIEWGTDSGETPAGTVVLIGYMKLS